MLDRIANGHAERKQEHLCNSEERSAEHDVSNRPSVIQRPEH